MTKKLVRNLKLVVWWSISLEKVCGKMWHRSHVHHWSFIDILIMELLLFWACSLPLALSLSRFCSTNCAIQLAWPLPLIVNRQLSDIYIFTVFITISRADLRSRSIYLCLSRVTRFSCRKGKLWKMSMAFFPLFLLLLLFLSLNTHFVVGAVCVCMCNTAMCNVSHKACAPARPRAHFA